EHVAETGIAIRSFAVCLTAQSLHPVVARPADESARQELNDRVEVGFGNFPASKFWREHCRIPISPLLKLEGLPDRGRPPGEVSAVGMEHGDREAIHAERDTAGMGGLAAGIPDVPGQAKMVAVIIEAHAGGRLLLGTQRNQKFEFQRLLLLA